MDIFYEASTSKNNYKRTENLGNSKFINETYSLNQIRDRLYDDEARIFLSNQRSSQLKQLVNRVVDNSLYIYNNSSKITHCITCATLLANYKTTNFCPKCHK